MIERDNNRMASEALLIQAAAASMFSEEGGKHFGTLIDSMAEGDE